MRTPAKISVVIPWSNRQEFSTALLKNRFWLDRGDLDILAVNCGGDEHLLDEIISESDLRNIHKISVPRVRFNKALALNIGVHCSTAPNIFILDCDIILTTDFINDAIVALDGGTFVTVRAVRDFGPDFETQGDPVTLALKAGLLASIVTRQVLDFTFQDGSTVRLGEFCCTFPGGIRSGVGLLFARREHLIGIEGYHSQLERWGWEDDDIQFRLKRVLDLQQIEIGEGLHIRHGDDKRALYGELAERSNWINFGACCARYARGDFRGTYSDDVAEWETNPRGMATFS